MSKKPIPGSYIDTQGMGAPADPNYKGPTGPVEYKPGVVKPRRLFTPEYVNCLLYTSPSPRDRG